MHRIYYGIPRTGAQFSFKFFLKVQIYVKYAQQVLGIGINFLDQTDHRRIRIGKDDSWRNTRFIKYTIEYPLVSIQCFIFNDRACHDSGSVVVINYSYDTEDHLESVCVVSTIYYNNIIVLAI